MNLSYFETLAEADGYIIETVPWVGYCAENKQTVYCKEDNKRIVVYNNTMELGSLPEMVDLGLSVKWAKYNYGVNPEQLTSASDWYGKYLSWGEVEEKAGWDGQGTKVPYDWTNYKYANGASNKLTKYCNKSFYGNEGYTDELKQLVLADDVASVNYGGSWRMPVQAELEELITLPSQWVANYNGIQDLNGRLFTGTNGNILFIPAAGNLRGSDTDDTSSCRLWSSSLYLDNPSLARALNFNSSGYLGTSLESRSRGLSIRPVLQS